MPVEFAAVEYPDNSFFAFEETGFAFEHLRADIAAADFADGESLDACRCCYVCANLRSVGFALTYIAIANDNNRCFFGTAILVAVGA